MSYRLLVILVVISIGLLESGCTSVAKGMVDTQPKVEFSEQDYQKPETIVNGQPVFYTVDLGASTVSDPDLPKYAPILVQGFQPKSNSYSYPYWADGIGSPSLNRDGDAVIIDTSQPAAFCRVEYNQVYGQRLKQLVYVFWYPQRPVGTLESGEIDGNILRITLDGGGRPAIFEYSQTCGCFHGVFVARHIEGWAWQEYRQPLAGKNYAVEKSHPKHSDWLVRDLIAVDPGQRPALFISAGKHFCQAIRFSHRIQTQGYTNYAYRLVPYARLNRIPKADGSSGSMFNAKGLVIGGKRWKEELFLPALDHPGWPRHLDKMLIHWDEARWNDPHLLAQYLRLPRKIKQDSGVDLTTAVKLSRRDNKSAAAKAPMPGEICAECDRSKPYILIFTHKYCVACQSFKKDILPLSQVQKALERWNCVLLDIFEPKNKELADRYRIDVTPSFIVFDQPGRELGRTTQLDTPEKFIAYLQRYYPVGTRSPINDHQTSQSTEKISFRKFPTPTDKQSRQSRPALAVQVGATADSNKPFMVLFTHRMCLGCQQFKKLLHSSPAAAAEIKKWNYIELDMFEADNARLAQVHAVESTPTLILFSKDRNEIARNARLETVEAFLRFLSRFSPRFD